MRKITHLGRLCIIIKDMKDKKKVVGKSKKLKNTQQINYLKAIPMRLYLKKRLIEIVNEMLLRGRSSQNQATLESFTVRFQNNNVTMT